MVAVAGSRRRASQVLELGGDPYLLVTQEEASQLRRERAWRTRRVAQQQVNVELPFVIDLGTFHMGYGFSYAETPGVYERARKWDASTPGKIRTYPRLTTGEAFSNVDARGWVIQHASYVYVLRGRYSAKYQVNDVPNAEWSILEFHNFGTDIRMAGRPATFQGDLYVPLVNSSGTLQRFHRLTTQNTPVTEVQTLTMSGSPTGGTFTVTFNDGVTSTATAAMAFNITAANMQTELRLIPGLQKVTVARSGGPTTDFTWTVTLTAAPTALGSTSPPQFTVDASGLTGGAAPTVTPATTVAGTGDQWDQGPVARTARAFRVWREKLVRGATNLVALASTDPMTAGNWSAEYEVGDSGVNITDLGVYDTDLIVAKEDGPWAFNESFVARELLPDLKPIVHAQNCVGMEYAQGYLFVPHQVGTIRWRPGAFAHPGAEQDDWLEGDLTSGWGRVMGIAPAGKRIYATIADTVNRSGAVVSWQPGQRRAAGFIPHMIDQPSTELEHCAVVTLGSQPPQSYRPSAISNNNAVGTIAWTGPSQASASDDQRALATAGTSQYLFATLAAETRVPTGATINGIRVRVERRKTGSGAAVVDNSVRLIIGGSVSGDNKGTSTEWQVDVDETVEYGGANDLWGTAPSVAQANAADFGVALSAVVTTGQAEVDGIEILIYYTLAGAGDPGAYLVTLRLDATRTQVTPDVYKLPRHGLAPSNDPNIAKELDDADFYTARYYAPSRAVRKTYREVELWLEASPEAATPGVRVYAAIDDEETQARDGGGGVTRLRTTGPHRVFLPPKSDAVGHYVALRFNVPARAAGEVRAAYTIRDVKIHGVYHAVSTTAFEAAIVIRAGQLSDGTFIRRTPEEQRARLEALRDPQDEPIEFTDPDTGERGHVHISDVQFLPFNFKGMDFPELIATVSGLVLRYD